MCASSNAISPWRRRPDAVSLLTSPQHSRQGMQELYLDDFDPGQTFGSKGVTLSESQILDFALLYDPQPFNPAMEHAAEGPFHGLLPPGLPTLALASRIFYQTNVI